VDKKTALEIAKRYSKIVSKEFPVRRVILFGSHAKGEERSNSDIDIAVIIEKLEGDFLEAQIKLFKLRRSIDLRIEPVLIEETEDKTGFLREVLNSGIEVYSKETIP